MILLFYSQIGIDQSLAVIAEVEPQKTAISFPKSVRIKAIYVSPGQSVEKGDLLLEVDRPDLVLDLQKVSNDLQLVESQLVEATNKKNATKEVLLLKYIRDTTGIKQEINELYAKLKSDTSAYRPLNIKVAPSEQFRLRLKEVILVSKTLNTELRGLE